MYAVVILMGRFNKKIMVLCIGVILSITLCLSQCQICAADIADTASFIMGGAMSNSSLSLPRANAKIRILHSEDGDIDISVTCNFEVMSSGTVNASLAFVYPQYWDLGSGLNNVWFNVAINDTILDHMVANYSYLVGHGYTLNSTELGGTWIESAEFALFNYQMQAAETYVIRVTTPACPMQSNNYASFSYIIASAKTFQGQTHQTVEMHVIEEKSFVDFSFYPEEYLTESSNSTGTTATWDLVIDQDTSINMVTFSATIGEYRPYRPWPIIVTEVVIAGSGLAVIILTVLVVLRYKRR